MPMFHTRDSQMHDFAADEAYRVWLISRNQPPIIHHSPVMQWKRLRVTARHARNHVRAVLAAVRVAFAADKMRRVRCDMARVWRRSQGVGR